MRRLLTGETGQPNMVKLQVDQMTNFQNQGSEPVVTAGQGRRTQNALWEAFLYDYPFICQAICLWHFVGCKDCSKAGTSKVPSAQNQQVPPRAKSDKVKVIAGLISRITDEQQVVHIQHKRSSLTS